MARLVHPRGLDRQAWTYANLLDFAERVRRDTRDLRPRDMIDLQSFIRPQGSGEYDESRARRRLAFPARTS
jgi:hypothetical protein